MKLEYQLAKQDYIDFSIFHMTYSNTMRRALFIQRFIISLVFLVMPFFLMLLTDIPLVYWLVVFITIWLLWVVFYPNYLKRFVTKRISAMVDEGKNSDMLGKHTLSLNDEGIVDASENSESKIKWNAIEHVAESKNHIFIYISAVMALIVPVGVFDSEGQKREFLAILDSKVGKDKK